jgi:hypothetical protein
MTTHRYTGRTLEARLAARTTIDPLSGCHLWDGACNRGGYAVVTLHGKRHLGHRLAWTLKFGTIPPGLVLSIAATSAAASIPTITSSIRSKPT